MVMIPMTQYKHIMLYFDEFIHLWLKSEYIVVPLKILQLPILAGLDVKASPGLVIESQG